MHKCGWTTVVAALFIVAPTYIAPRAQAGTSAQPQASAESSPAHKSTTHAQPYERVLLRPSLLTRKAPATYKVKFTTTKGDFVITVTRAWAPLGADRFYNLVRHHYYDDTSFFRVLKGFVVQWGISPYPPVNVAWDHAPIKDDPVVQSNLRGYITYAMGGPNTRTAQVFINLVDNKRLDGMGFAAFGQVTEGMDVVDSLYSGYGEGAPDGQGPAQDKLEKSGKPYLDKDFPLLDSIKTARLILPETTAPSKAHAAKTPSASEK
jgi:peptidyl-prolyl cis-trans isomerase A (cyclophilin A)